MARSQLTSLELGTVTLQLQPQLEIDSEQPPSGVPERGVLSPAGDYFYVCTHNGFSGGPDGPAATSLMGYDVAADGSLTPKSGFPITVGPNPFDMLTRDL